MLTYEGDGYQKGEIINTEGSPGTPLYPKQGQPKENQYHGWSVQNTLGSYICRTRKYQVSIRQAGSIPPRQSRKLTSILRNLTIAVAIQRNTQLGTRPEAQVTRARLGRICVLREGRRVGQTTHAAQQDLHLAKGNSRLPCWHHVARQVDEDPRKAPLLVPGTQDALPAGTRQVSVVVVRHEQGLVGYVLKTHLAVPRHVLDGKQSPISKENHVHGPVCDLDVVGSVDDVRDRLVRRRIRVVAALEDGLGGADFPVDIVGCVDGLFYVGPVEVDLGAGGYVLLRRREPQDVVGDGQELGDLVDVEARVDLQSGAEDEIEDVAPFYVVGAVGVDTWALADVWLLA